MIGVVITVVITVVRPTPVALDGRRPVVAPARLEPRACDSDAAHVSELLERPKSHGRASGTTRAHVGSEPADVGPATPWPRQGFVALPTTLRSVNGGRAHPTSGSESPGPRRGPGSSRAEGVRQRRGSRFGAPRTPEVARPRVGDDAGPRRADAIQVSPGPLRAPAGYSSERTNSSIARQRSGASRSRGSG